MFITPPDIPTAAGHDLPARTRLPFFVAVMLATSLVIICFQIYWQYWFIRLFRGHLLTTLAPIAVIGSLAARDLLLCHDRRVQVGSALRNLWLPLMCLGLYVSAATYSVLTHESGEDIRRYLIYVYSPIAIFVGLLGLLRSYCASTHVRLVQSVICAGVLLAAATLPLYFYESGAVLARLKPVITPVSQVAALSGGTFGTNDGFRIRRLYAPGINIAAAGYGCVVLVLLALALRSIAGRMARNAYAAAALLFSLCVLLTITRGPAIALAIGACAWVYATGNVWERAVHGLQRSGATGLLVVLRGVVAAAVVVAIAWLAYYARDGRLIMMPLAAAASPEHDVFDTGSQFVDMSRILLHRFAFMGVNSSTTGGILAPLVVILLALGRGASDMRRILYSGAAWFLAVCIILTISRVALAALVAGMFFLLLRRVVRPAELVMLAAVVIAVSPLAALSHSVRLTTAVMTLLPPDKVATVGRWFALSEVGNDPHILEIAGTMSTVASSPIAGIGVRKLTDVQNNPETGIGVPIAGKNGQPSVVTTTADINSATTYGKTENNYLSVAASFGVVAIAGYILFIGSLMQIANRALRHRPVADETQSLGIGLLAAMWTLVVYLNGAPAEFHFIWVWFAFVAVWVVAAAADSPVSSSTIPTADASSLALSG